MSDNSRECPACNEEIQAAALRCRHCGTILIAPEWREAVSAWRLMPTTERAAYEVTLTPEQLGKLYVADLVLPHTVGRRFKVIIRFTFGDMLGQTLLWVLLGVFTLGIALIAYPYYLLKFVANGTELQEV